MRLVKSSYKINKDFFEAPLDEISSYWLGFILADGYIRRTSKNSVYWGIKLHRKDRKSLEQMTKDMGSTFPVRDYVTLSEVSGNRFCSLIHVHDRKMVSDLEYWGVKVGERNCENVFKLNSVVLRDVIRGLFDGDGNITVAKGKYPRATFLGSLGMLELLKDCLVKVCGMDEVQIQNRGKIGALRYYGWRSHALEHFMYDGANRFMERKRVKFLTV